MSEFTYRVLPSNIYRSLIGRLFFTLFTVAIMSDKRKTILDFFGGNKKRKDDDNTTESCFRHPLFDLRGTQKVEMRHTNFHFSSKKSNLEKLKS